MARSTAVCPTSRTNYKDWKAPENSSYIDRAVNDCLASEDPNNVTGEIIVPQGKLNRATEKNRKRREDATYCAIYGDVETEPKNESALLTTENNQKFIQRIIKMRDERKKMVYHKQRLYLSP